MYKSVIVLFTAPDFVNSLVHGNYVYFFFRETAVEYINCGKVSLNKLLIARELLAFWFKFRFIVELWTLQSPRA